MTFPDLPVYDLRPDEGPTPIDDLSRLTETQRAADLGIAKFWEEWPTLAPLLETDLADGRHGPGSDLLTGLADAVNPGLEWDILPGREARHALCLSAAADLALRGLTERWLKAAPPANEMWEFHPARISLPLENIVIGETEIDPEDAAACVTVDSRTETLEVIVCHSRFAGMDETLQLQAAFRMLDDLLGEDDAEKWLGSVETAPRPPGPSLPFPEVAERAAELAAAATGEKWDIIPEYDGEEWVNDLHINRALKRVDHLEMTALAIINLETPNPDRSGPAAQLERELSGILGPRGMFFARAYYEDYTVLYAYLHPTAAAEIREAAARNSLVYQTTVQPDETWNIYHQMM